MRRAFGTNQPPAERPGPKQQSRRLCFRGLGEKGVPVSLDARSAARAQPLNDGQGGGNGPDEEAKGGGGLGDLALVEAVAVDGDLGGNGDGAGEPEHGGDGEQGEADNGVVEAGEGALDEAGVDDDDNGPERVEEHKVEAGFVAVGDADDCDGRNAPR